MWYSPMSVMAGLQDLLLQKQPQVGRVQLQVA